MPDTNYINSEHLCKCCVISGTAVAFLSFCCCHVSVKTHFIKESINSPSLNKVTMSVLKSTVHTLPMLLRICLVTYISFCKISHVITRISYEKFTALIFFR